MTERDTRDEVRAYLSRLDDALVGVPVATARDIRAGIEEELLSLDATAVRSRIAAIGDPTFVAAAARGETRDASRSLPRSAAAESRGYVVGAALALGFGGAMVPVVGWLVGIVLVWRSRAWRRWEKVVATLTPVAALATAAAAFALVVDDSSGALDTSDGPTGVSLFVPAVYDIAWTAVVAMIVANLAVGVWLLARGLGNSRRSGHG